MNEDELRLVFSCVLTHQSLRMIVSPHHHADDCGLNRLEADRARRRVIERQLVHQPRKYRQSGVPGPRNVPP
jgi:hypothetical protein